MQQPGDFHIHTNYCPHGTTDSMEDYVRAAINKGLKAISFTEHAPFPKAFTDPTPTKDSAMLTEDLEKYFAEGNRLKKRYQDKINIYVGFELDYIIGFEKETKTFLDTYGEQMGDGILSVHMLQAPDGSFVCLDYSLENFANIIVQFGSVDKVYQAYFKTVAASIEADLGKYKPNRIGHISLIEKFAKKYPPLKNYQDNYMQLLQLIKNNNYTLDANTAGLYKADCGKMYPPQNLMEIADQMGIALVPGSDSHAANTIARGFDQLPASISYTFPKK
ncbi:histidinol-phosphatase [Paraliobacillus ryukyuensis]|uniref:Histidinol-phosphatase n=1 Tax=Paraliobacillus ryukyuensis TaxID=200904 RepID=A0A366EGZ3_9BACI|nr:histidinol-phosphatase HisJ [Paraliobacillus ryukyuensis]RBP01682.1 histidinol-phosphate phosphatase [Paraliobacillus ryukyuensis]